MPALRQTELCKLFPLHMLARFFDAPGRQQKMVLPRPFGVLYAAERPCYEDLLYDQLKQAVGQKGEGRLDELLAGSTTWEIS